MLPAYIKLHSLFKVIRVFRHWWLRFITQIWLLILRQAVCILVLWILSLGLLLKWLLLLRKVTKFAAKLLIIKVRLKSIFISTLSKKLSLNSISYDSFVSPLDILGIMVRPNIIRYWLQVDLLFYLLWSISHISKVRVIQAISGCRPVSRIPYHHFLNKVYCYRWSSSYNLCYVTRSEIREISSYINSHSIAFLPRYRRFA